MEVSFMILLLSACAVILLHLPTSCHGAVDTISGNQALQDGETLVSDGEMFEMGFFSPGRSNNRYVGIWYKKISLAPAPPTIVWVANRETPITTNTLGMFKVSSDGNLVIINRFNTHVIWSSNSTLSVRNPDHDPVAQLLDSGNLVLWDTISSNNRNVIWQSFDHPGDTLLPGMKLGKDLVTGREWAITSWKSLDDPSPGKQKNMVDTNGYPQIVGWKGSVLIGRLGLWNGLGYSGSPPDIPNPIYSTRFVFNQNEIYHTYELTSSVLRRMVLTWDGKTLILHWIVRIQNWVVYEDVGADVCGRYALCGPFGICSLNKHPPCTCMEGFEPQFPQEWNGSDWSSGCQRKKPLDCGGSGDGFWKTSGLKLPDTRWSWYNMSMTLAECKMACTRNCS